MQASTGRCSCSSACSSCESSLWCQRDAMPQACSIRAPARFEFRLPEVIITVALIGTPRAPGPGHQRIGVPRPVVAAVAAWWALEALSKGSCVTTSRSSSPSRPRPSSTSWGATHWPRGCRCSASSKAPASSACSVVGALGGRPHPPPPRPKRTTRSSIPLLKLTDFGMDGSDAATIFVVDRGHRLPLELHKERRSRLNLLCVVPLAPEPLLRLPARRPITLVAVVAVVVLVALGSRARQRLRVTVGRGRRQRRSAVVGVVLGVSVIPAITAQQSVTGPASSIISSTLGETLNSQQKSSRPRTVINKWTVSYSCVRQHRMLHRPGAGV